MDFKPNKLTPGYNLMWESSRMMLPEHVTALHQANFEDKKVEKPVIDEQLWDEFSMMFSEAMEYKKRLKITIWKNGFFEDITGWLHNIDLQLKRLRLDLDEIDVDYINLEDIIAVEFAD